MSLTKLTSGASNVFSYASEGYSKLDNLSIQYLGNDILGFLFGSSENSSLNKVKLFSDNIDILIDWCIKSNDTRSSNLKTKVLEDKDGTLITTSIEKDNRKIDLECEFSIFLEGAREKLGVINSFWESKTLLSFIDVELIENLVITNLSEPIENENIVKFSMSLEQITFAKLKTVVEAQAEYQTQMKTEQNIGLQGVTSSGIKPEGALF